MNEKSLVNKTWILILSLMMVPMTGLTIDIYTPSLPYITHYFNSTDTLTQLSISIYVFGYSMSQSFYGAISDSLGRRNLILGGLFLYVVASLTAPLAANMGTLLLVRFLQGVGVGGPGVLTRSIFSDCFTGKELTKFSNYITIAWAAGPIVAPFIGGYLQGYFGWEASFYFMSAYGFLALIFSLLFLPETINHYHPFKISNVLNSYKIIITHKVFIGLALIIALGYSLIVIFNVVGPYLIQKVLGYSPIDYGHIVLFLGLAWFLGNVTNRFLIEKISQHSIINSNIIISIILSIIMLGIAVAGYTNIYVVIIPVLLLFYSVGIAFPNFFGKAISLFPKMGGIASASLGSLVSMGGAVTSAVISLVHTNTQLPLAAIYFAAMITFATIYVLIVKPSFNFFAVSDQ